MDIKFGSSSFPSLLFSTRPNLFFSWYIWWSTGNLILIRVTKNWIWVRVIKDIQPVFWTITRVSNWPRARLQWEGGGHRTPDFAVVFQESVRHFFLPSSFPLPLFNRPYCVACTLMQHRPTILSSFYRTEMAK